MAAKSDSSSRSGDPILRWTTASVSPAQRLEYFTSALAEALIPMKVERRSAAPFHAEMRFTSLGAVEVGRQIGDAHFIHRGPREIEQSQDQSVHLIMNVASDFRLVHCNQAVARLGHPVFIGSERATRLELGSFDVMHLKMSAAWVDQWVPDVRKLYGRPIVPDSGWGAALAAYMRQLSPEAVAASPLPKSLMLDQLGGLLTLAATDLTDVRPLLSRSSRQLRGRIHDSVKQQCASTALTALDVARALGISVRTLHRCLAANGETFGEVLIGARTDLALRMLASRAFDSLTNAEIARRAGFSDPSHFARTVHRHTGRTPTQFRKEGR